ADKAVEEEAGERLLSTLPDDLREEYEKYFVVQDGDEEIWKIVKSADRLSALIKCIDERRMGNMEFCKAEESTRKIIEENMTPELAEFIKEFMPSYGMTLDEQIKKYNE
ncbi:MAG: YfbR-like 5'-deoxynucleotidase, partial [Pseudoruminococcus massiliensis]